MNIIVFIKLWTSCNNTAHPTEQMAAIHHKDLSPLAYLPPSPSCLVFRLKSSFSGCFPHFIPTCLYHHHIQKMESLSLWSLSPSPIIIHFLRAGRFKQMTWRTALDQINNPHCVQPVGPSCHFHIFILWFVCIHHFKYWIIQNEWLTLNSYK